MGGEKQESRLGEEVGESIKALAESILSSILVIYYKALLERERGQSLLYIKCSTFKKLSKSLLVRSSIESSLTSQVLAQTIARTIWKKDAIQLSSHLLLLLHTCFQVPPFFHFFFFKFVVFWSNHSLFILARVTSTCFHQIHPIPLSPFNTTNRIRSNSPSN